MRRRRGICILLGLLLGVCLAPALEVDAGRMRLILHEGMGRFSLYARPLPSSPETVPLFVDQDPRTSGISLVLNDRIYKIGESAAFKETVEPGSGPVLGRFRFRSRTVEVIQEFTPVSSDASRTAEGLRMVIRIENRSRSPVTAGLRICLDTYLGEENLSHFRSDLHREIRNELTVSSSEMVRYWLSPSADRPQTLGLLCLTRGSQITSPDRIVFANWKRLSEASWEYKTASSRNFNLMPYSVNDSAVCMYYDPLEVQPGESREIALVLANSTLSYEGGIVQAPAAVSADGGSGQSAAGSLEELRKRVQAGSASAPPLENLDDLNSLLELIDTLLASGQEISDEDVRLMEEILSAIKDRSERYSGGQ